MKKDFFGKLFFMLLMVGLIWASDVFAEMKISASDGTKGDGFGESVAIDGNIAVVGTSYFTDAAYIFELGANGAWSQSAKLLPSEINPGAYFGNSVAVSGDYILVGSRYDVHDHGSGSVYVFKRNTAGNWMQTAKIRPEVGHDNEIFAWSVSLSRKMAVISALVSTPDANSSRFSGVAYVFVRNSDETWTQQARLLAPDGYDNDYFGASVTIYGKYIAVGAYLGKNKGLISGAAYIYKQNVDNTWSQVTKLYPSDYRQGASFGISVFLLEDNLIVGAYRDSENEPAAGAAYIFKRKAESEWQEMTKLTAGDGDEGDLFGRSVALHGNLAVIGASGEYGNYNFGAAYLFKRDTSGKWHQENKVSVFDRFNDQYFGSSVAISNTHVLAGAPGRWSTLNGSAYIYPVDEDATTPSGKSPEPPTGLSATAGKFLNKIRITWAASHGAEAYEIYRAEKPASQGGVLEKIHTTTAIVYGDTTVKRGIIYYYWIKVKNLFGSSAFSQYDTGYCGDIKPPMHPENVTASDGEFPDKIRITWTSAEGADVYEIFRAEKPVSQGGVLERIRTTTATVYDDTTVKRGITYYYWIKAKNLFVGSEFSDYNTGYTSGGEIPDVPKNIRASNGKHEGMIGVTWQASSTAEFYDVYRRKENQAYKKIGSTNKTFYHDKEVICGTKYQYNIIAVNTYGNSGLSEYADKYSDSGTSGGCPPLSPGWVYASDGKTPNNGMITIVWSGSFQATSYEVYRAEQIVVPGSRTKIATVANIFYNDSSAECGITYYYWIKAKNAYGVSSFSEYNTGHRGTCEPPSAPSGFITTKGIYYSGYVYLKWNKSSLATSYDIFRAEKPEHESLMTQIGTTTKAHFKDSEAVNGVTYYYRIRASNMFGESDFSSYSIGYSFDHIQNAAAIETKLIAEDGANWDNFGQSVAIYGDNILVGAYGDDDNGNHSGSVYIYERFRDGNWLQTEKLYSGAGGKGYQFGLSVALSENVALVGSLDTGPEGGKGAGYIFEREPEGRWSQVARLLPYAPHPYTGFGQSVALHGNTALIADDWDDEVAGHSGAVYIYERNQDDIWALSKKLKAPEPLSNEEFGSAIAIHGNVAIIGASGNSHDIDTPGTIYVFEKSPDGVWINTYKKTLPWLVSSNSLVISLDSADDIFVVGLPYDDEVASNAGVAYIFQRNYDNTWFQSAKLTASDAQESDRFGRSVAVDDDVLVVGAIGDKYFGYNSGSAYVFEKIWDGNWEQVNKIMPSDRRPWKQFGHSVSISGDSVLVGSNKDDTANGRVSGSAYIYDLSASELSVPSNVDASDGDYEGKIRITWDASPNATYYDVFRGDKRVIDGGDAIKLMSTFDTFYNDISASCGTSYYYWVKSKNVMATSKFSKFDTGNATCW